LRGLDYVHNAKTSSGRELGIVHRDMTPSNIYISNTGQIKLGDFGVAKLVGVESWTMAGSLKGKLGYLSPEQVGGEPPTQHIDLWSAGIMFYEMLAGERVFTGEHELEVMLRIKAAKVPAIRKVNKTVSKRLESILEKALHKKLKKRYQSAAEFLVDVQTYQTKEGRPVTPEQLVQYLRATLA
jgi:eukaryotic-like serine/threonine-protein kinase